MSGHECVLIAEDDACYIPGFRAALVEVMRELDRYDPRWEAVQLVIILALQNCCLSRPKEASHLRELCSLCLFLDVLVFLCEPLVRKIYVSTFFQFSRDNNWIPLSISTMAIYVSMHLLF